MYYSINKLALYDVAERIAIMRGMTINEVADAAGENFHSLFSKLAD